MFHQQHMTTNLLLGALSPSTLDRIWPELQPVHIRTREVIDHAEGQVPNLYFINQGLVSLVKTLEDGRTAEVAAVGIEGITDPNVLFGLEDSALMDSVVQVPGTAFRIPRDALRREIERDDLFATMMQRYAHFYVSQIVQTSACNRLHSLEERCCRWLLTAHDSALSDTFPLTHEFLAIMLGVQRSWVSIVASLLKRAGLIEYSRGQVTIRDRRGLEDASCECYRSLTERRSHLFDMRDPGSKSVTAGLLVHSVALASGRRRDVRR